jgi:L-ascorbate metabolism protein UlaG (beta-lactamase superfamily)
MKINYYGHSCFSVETSGTHLLFDPFITPNGLAKSVDTKKIKADFILISHAHEDHMADAIDIAKRTEATLISGWEITEWFGKKGLQKVHPMNHGGGFNFPFGRVKYVSAIHSSSFPDGTYGGNPGGFVVETKEGNFYYTGDTALTMDMKIIGESTKLTFAAMCIGDNFTMGYEDAVKAADFVKCEKIVGVHYDTFPPIKIDHQKAIEYFKSKGKTLHLIPIGQSLEI